MYFYQLMRQKYMEMYVSFVMCPSYGLDMQDIHAVLCKSQSLVIKR
jgi:hypothetical protein